MPSSLTIDTMSCRKSPNCLLLPVCLIASKPPRQEVGQHGSPYLGCGLLALALAPGAISRLVAVPRAPISGELLERYLVDMAVWALITWRLFGGLRWWLRRWLCHGVLP